MSLLINKISELLFLFVIFQLTNLRISCFLPEAHSFFRKISINSVVGNLDVVCPLIKVAAKEVGQSLVSGL